jgi:outer membrane protein OmpA-like peptidoglycan-associated protein
MTNPCECGTQRGGVNAGTRLAAAAVLLAFATVAAPSAALAQDAAPNTEQMVEALKPRTRSLRNLVVGEPAASAPVAGPATAAGLPSLPDPPSATAPPESPAAQPSLSMAIRFDFDSARLRPEGAAVLDRLATALQTSDLKGSRFLIEGHTDAKGLADYNLRLSQQRADEVRRYLQLHGVAEQRLSAVGRGSQEPANAAQPLAAENRRVRIVNVE